MSGIRKRVTKFFPLLGLVVFLYIIMNVDLEEILLIISDMNPFLLSISVIIVIPIVLMRSFKWNILIRSYGTGLPFSSVVKAFLVGFSVSMVTPARIGDLYRARYLKNHTTTGKALTTVIIDRLVDVFVLFFLGLVGILSFLSLFAQKMNMVIMVLIMFVLFIAAVFVLTKEGFIRFLFEPVFRRFVPEKHKEKIGLTFREFYKGMRKIRKKRNNLFMVIALGFMNYLLSILQAYLIAMGMGLELSYVFFLMVIPLVGLLDIIPVSFSGIGTRDAAMIVFFSFFALSKEIAISFSLMILLLGYVSIGFIGALVIVSGNRLSVKE